MSARLDEWLAQNRSPESERFRSSIRPGAQLTIISRDVNDSVDGRTYFRGTAVAPEQQAIAFGVEGWKDLPGSTDEFSVAGEWVLARWGIGGVRVRRDVFSSVGMAYTEAAEFCAISDSLLVLDDLRRHFALPRTQHADALLGRSVLNGHAAQQMSPDTYVEEIKWVPAAQGIDVSSRSLRAAVVGAPMASRVLSGGSDYVGSLRSAASFISGGVAALSGISGWGVELNLSGGYDSRIILSGAMVAGVADKLTVVTANRVAAQDDDYVAALSLSKEFGFDLNPSRDRSQIVDYGLNPMTIWASSLLGTYDRLMPASSRRTATREFSLTGIGAEILKGNWGWRDIDAIVADVDLAPERSAAYRRQIEAGVRAVGGDPKWSDASELQYVGYRNGIHGAGHIAMSMTGIRLLQQLSLATLGHMRADGRAPLEHRESARLVGSGTPVTDLLCVLHPGLAAAPYDSPEKQLAPDYVRRRATALGNALNPAEMGRVRVLGSPATVPAGPSVLGDEVAKGRGFDIQRTPAEILRLAESALDRLSDDTVRATYREVLENARWRMLTKALPPEHAGPSTAKALSMVLFT